jgi:hypothetical protein
VTTLLRTSGVRFGKNAVILMLKQVVHIVTTGVWKAKRDRKYMHALRFMKISVPLFQLYRIEFYHIELHRKT